MKKKIITIATVFTLLIMCNGNPIKAQETQQYYIGDDYIIMDYKKYDLVDNKVKYNGLVYELKNGSLVSVNNGIESVIVLPVEENKITDEETIKELNRLAGNSNDKIRAVQAQNLPYYKTVPSGEWNSQTPIFNINKPGQLEIPVVYLKITTSMIQKRFSISYVTGDIAGDWFTQKFSKDIDFSLLNYRRYVPTTATRYAMWTIGALYSNAGYNYSLTTVL